MIYWNLVLFVWFCALVEREKENLVVKLEAYSETDKVLKSKETEISSLTEKIKEFESIVDGLNKQKEVAEELSKNKDLASNEKISEIETLKEQVKLLNEEILQTNVDFEKEKANLIKSAKEEASVELKKLNEECKTLLKVVQTH